MLQVACDQRGRRFIAFRLYDSGGELVEDSNGLRQLRADLMVKSGRGEVLLNISMKSSTHILYRLYNKNGQLLTNSDGAKTRLYPMLRMETVSRNWTLPTGLDAAS